MQSKVETVTLYLQEIPHDRLEALTKLRELCLSSLIGYTESMEYGMPCYSKNGVVEVAFASQKNYLSLYILKQHVVNAHRDALKGASIGKSCIKYANQDNLNWDVIAKLLTDTLRFSETPC